MTLREFLSEKFGEKEPTATEFDDAMHDYRRHLHAEETRRKATNEYLREHPEHPFVW